MRLLRKLEVVKMRYYYRKSFNDSSQTKRITEKKDCSHSLTI